MDQALNQVVPGFVWPTVGHPGVVPLWALAPNPNQPRKHFGEEELNALAETMKPENDGEQREILTVRELTEEERVLYYPARYLIISGERRWRAAGRAGVAEVEIRVKSYKSRGHEKLDAFMLNNGRVNLSDMENALYLADLMEEFGWTTQEEIASNVGESTAWVSQHLALLSLSPKAREAMSPELSLHQRLKRGVGVFLSRLSFAVQDDFVERMPKGRATAQEQIRWMRDELKGTPDEPEAPKFQPATLRRVVGYFADQVHRRTDELLKKEGLERLFENATVEQCNELLGRMKDAQEEMNELVTRIVELHAADEQKRSTPKTKPASPPVRPQPANRQSPPPSAERFLERRKELEKPKDPPRPEPVRAKVQVPDPAPKPPPAPTPVPHFSRNGPPRASKVASAPSVLGGLGKEKTVTYMGDVGRKVTDKVSQRRYVELFDKGQLGFQIDGKERPEWMPSREEALTEWDKFCS